MRGGVWGGEGQIRGRLGPGGCAGELGLLVGDRRTATGTCARAAETLVLSKSDFAELVITNQAALGVLLTIVSQRARSLARGAAPPCGTRMVVVTATADVSGAKLVAAGIAECTLACGAGDALVVMFASDAPALADVTAADIVTRRGRPASLCVKFAGAKR